jgi:uncharacterized protein YegP (UPF0339 family)
MKKHTYEVYRAKDGWRWRLKSGNHKIIADSAEAYANKHSCLSAARRMVNVGYSASIKVV